MIFEDKLIVEYALSLWAGCLLHRSDLFEKFTQLDGEVKAEDLLLNGLLYCPYESVREEFKATCAVLCSKAQGDSKVNPLDYILKLLTSNFSLISKYPCKQYFGLLCELLDKYFLSIKLRPDGSQVLDLEALLSSVIDRIREENQKAMHARSEGSKSAQSSS
jgi:hypothetical protein